MALSARIGRLVVACVTALAVPSGLTAADPSVASGTRRYSVPGHGSILLDVPVSWEATVTPPTSSMPTIVRFQAPSGEVLLISIFPNTRQDPGFNTPLRVKRQVEETGRDLLPTAVETRLVVHELKGASHVGYYYSLTDRALIGKPTTPDDFKHLSNGQIGVGDLLLLFTILSNDPSSHTCQVALDILQGATHERSI